MFGLLSGLTKVVVGVVALPVAAVVDVAKIVIAPGDDGRLTTEKALNTIEDGIDEATGLSNP